MSQHALCPGTFDPVTNGHLDILSRALRLWERVTVAVARGGRGTLFPSEERARLVRESLADLAGAARCDVIVFDGLLVDAVRETGADLVVRGLRGPADLWHEQSMAAVNAELLPGFEAVFLFARPGLCMVSGSIVRDVARCGGPVEHYVPPPVAVALRERFADG